jgi:hypothetical protein
MKGLVGKLFIVYACLMKLYPARYQREFGEERQEVFALALEEAIRRGNRALFRLIHCELHDFPASAIRANLRELEVMMKTSATKLGDERLSLIGLLLGVWPFLVSGPVLAILPYLPWPAEQLLNFNSPIWLVIVGLSLIIGIFVGWRRDFPRWVYPYLVILFFAIAIPLVGWLGSLVPSRINGWISTAIILVAILGLGAAALFFLSRIPATRKIYNDVRNDWTRLSFGMVVFLAFGTSIYLGDHLPPFGPAVWLPSVVVFFGAIAYLLCRNRLMRSIVLIATIGISFLGKFVLPTDDPWAIQPILLLVSLILSPVLVELFPRHNLPQVNEK